MRAGKKSKVLLVGFIIIPAMFFFSGTPNLIRMKDKVLDSQVIAGVYRIYEALNLYKMRFGEYPEYIWGGTRTGWEKAVNEGRIKEIYDPLIRKRILAKYPKNPFMKDARSLCQRTNRDPRFGCLGKDEEEREYKEYKIGEPTSGLVMGNILSDYRIGKITLSPESKEIITTSEGPKTYPPSYYFFVGDEHTQTIDWLPGQFGYRRLSPSRFVLFAYGNIRNKISIDLLNSSEQPLMEKTNQGEALPKNWALDALFQLGKEQEKLVGNPDGLPDGIIIVLTEKGVLNLPPKHLKSEKEVDK